MSRIIYADHCNYPVATRGGISQQRYEAESRIQRDGVKRLLKSAGVALEDLRTVIDLGCRNGDSTLGIAQVASEKTKVIGVEEYRQALLIAKAKFGLASSAEVAEIEELLRELPKGWLDAFREESHAISPRVSFCCSSIEDMAAVLSGIKADLIVGFQILHWLNSDEKGIPTLKVMNAISNSLVPGGRFIAGTSTAFIALDPNDHVEGKTRAEYVIDEHPFVKMVYDIISHFVFSIISSASEPISTKPPLSIGILMDLFENAGFNDIKTGNFLVTPGRKKVISEVVKLRPEHQGRLNSIEDIKLRKKIVDSAITTANNQCELIVLGGKVDPRLDNEHIYDVVPFIMATKI